MDRILKYLIGVMCVFLSTILLAEEPQYLWQKDLKLVKDKAGNLQYFDSAQKPLSGFYQIQLENGYIQANFANGFFHGAFKQVQNNRLKYQIEYCNSKPCGIYNSYFENGKLSKQKNYNSENQLNGVVKVYSSDDGRLLRKTHYKNGIKSGLEIVYFKSGLEAVKTRSNFVKDKKEGEETIYFHEGGLEVRQNYKKGLLQGRHTKMNPKGQKIFEVNYNNDRYHGTAKMFMDGNLWISKHYQDGKLHGKWVEYDLENKGVTKQVKYFEDDQEVEQKGWSKKEK